MKGPLEARVKRAQTHVGVNQVAYILGTDLNTARTQYNKWAEGHPHRFLTRKRLAQVLDESELFPQSFMSRRGFDFIAERLSDIEALDERLGALRNQLVLPRGLMLSHEYVTSVLHGAPMYLRNLVRRTLPSKGGAVRAQDFVSFFMREAGHSHLVPRLLDNLEKKLPALCDETLSDLISGTKNVGPVDGYSIVIREVELAHFPFFTEGSEQHDHLHPYVPAGPDYSPYDEVADRLAKFNLYFETVGKKKMQLSPDAPIHTKTSREPPIPRARDTDSLDLYMGYTEEQIAEMLKAVGVMRVPKALKLNNSHIVQGIDIVEALRARQEYDILRNFGYSGEQEDIDTLIHAQERTRHRLRLSKPAGNPDFEEELKGILPGEYEGDRNMNVLAAYIIGFLWNFGEAYIREGRSLRTMRTMDLWNSVGPFVDPANLVYFKTTLGSLEAREIVAVRCDDTRATLIVPPEEKMSLL